MKVNPRLPHHLSPRAYGKACPLYSAHHARVQTDSDGRQKNSRRPGCLALGPSFFNGRNAYNNSRSRAPRDYTKPPFRASPTARCHLYLTEDRQTDRQSDARVCPTRYYLPVARLVSLAPLRKLTFQLLLYPTWYTYNTSFCTVRKKKKVSHHHQSRLRAPH